MCFLANIFRVLRPREVANMIILVQNDFKNLFACRESASSTIVITGSLSEKETVAEGD